MAKRYIRSFLVSYSNKLLKNDIEVSELDIEKLVLNIKEKSIDYSLKDFLLSSFDNVIFLYKPPFMHTERQRPTDELCISDIVERDFKGFRLISRLDFETDGVLTAVGKNLNPSCIFKKYYAWVHGRVDSIILFDRRVDADKRRKVLVLDEKGDNVLKIIPLRHFNEYTLVEVGVEFAHRHQIRASFAFLGYPIVGDKLYGKGDYERLLLQCFFTKIDNYCVDLNELKPEVVISSLQNFR